MEKLGQSVSRTHGKSEVDSVYRYCVFSSKVLKCTGEKSLREIKTRYPKSRGYSTVVPLHYELYPLLEVDHPGAWC